MASDNRAAAALGHSYPGGLEAFVDAMNAKAALLDMDETRFVEPTGLSPANVSTASDLAKLVRAAHDYPLIREYSTKTRATVRASGRPLSYGNTNGLVRSKYWDIELSKTGYISEAGRCLVMQVRLAEKDLIVVLLDSWGKQSRIGDANRIRKWLEAAPRPAARAKGFRDDVVAGLSAPQKFLSQYFYDAAGSRLFARICRLARVLRDARRARAHAAPPRRDRALRRPRLPADRVRQRRGREEPAADPRRAPGGVRADRHLAGRARRGGAPPGARVPRPAHPSAAPATSRARSTSRCAAACRAWCTSPARPSATSRPKAHAFLSMSRGIAARMLVGVDLKKDPAVLHAAYNDSRGVTAAFNLNLLRASTASSARTSTCGAGATTRSTTRPPAGSRCTSYRWGMKVALGKHRFHFASGETIHTENSYKYSLDGFRELAARPASGAPRSGPTGAGCSPCTAFAEFSARRCAPPAAGGRWCARCARRFP